MAAQNRRKGRRPKGMGDTKEAILHAALKMFALNGFDRATVRAIANEAEVDPALVFHFFGGKDRLFFEAMKSRTRRPEPSDYPETRNLAEHGTRIVHLFLARWGGDREPSAFLGLLRSVSANPRAAAMLRRLFEETILPAVSESLGPEDAELRVALVGSQLLGVGAMRYVLKVEPLASAPIEDVARWVGPTIARYLEKPRG